VSCKLQFYGDGSELKKIEAYFSKIKTLAMETSTQNIASSTVLVPRETDLVVVGELKLAHLHCDHDSLTINKMIVYLHVPLAVSLFMMMVAH